MSGLSARRCFASRIAVLALAAMAGTQTGCTLLMDSPVQPDRVAAQPVETNAPFPNLGSVPDEPPTVSSRKERQTLLEQLSSDRKASGLPGTSQTGDGTEGDSN